jgi:hypothetical protein
MKKITSIYDRFLYFQKIEENWDCGRYKYGQQLKLSVKPSIDPLAGRAGFGLKINY